MQRTAVGVGMRVCLQVGSFAGGVSVLRWGVHWRRRLLLLMLLRWGGALYGGWAERLRG